MSLLGYERAMDYYQPPSQHTQSHQWGGFKSYQRSYYGTNFPSLFRSICVNSLKPTTTTYIRIKTTSSPTFSLDHSVRSSQFMLYFFNIPNGNPIPSLKTKVVFFLRALF